MIRVLALASLFWFTPATTLATAPSGIQPNLESMSPQQKQAALRPLTRSATECIARKVATDTRFDDVRQSPSANFGDLIVDAVPSCIAQVRALIDTYDRYFGDGTGEAFFEGPYLDLLPSAVNKWISQIVDERSP